MTCKADSLMVQAINSLTAQSEFSTAQKIRDRDAGQSLQQGGMQQWVLPDLAAIGPSSNVNQVNYTSDGIWLYLSKSGTTPGAEFTVNFAGGKSFTQVVPGTFIKGNFSGFQLENTGVFNGTARWVIGQNPETLYSEENIEGYGNVTPVVGATGSIATGAAAGANPPTGTPPAGNLSAVSIKAATAARALVASADGSNLVSASIRWWLYDEESAAWYLGTSGEVLTAGYPRAVSSDFAVGVKAGFVFAELYNNVNVGGVASTVTVQVL